MYLQFHSVIEPSKNRDIWLRDLFGSPQGRVRFRLGSVRSGFLHIFKFQYWVHFSSRQNLGSGLVRSCWVRFLSISSTNIYWECLVGTVWGLTGWPVPSSGPNHWPMTHPRPSSTPQPWKLTVYLVCVFRFFRAGTWLNDPLSDVHILQWNFSAFQADRSQYTRKNIQKEVWIDNDSQWLLCGEWSAVAAMLSEARQVIYRRHIVNCHWIISTAFIIADVHTLRQFRSKHFVLC